jgi:hypothetical protein
MADAALLRIGHIGLDFHGVPGFTNFALNQSTDQIEWIF